MLGLALTLLASLGGESDLVVLASGKSLRGRVVFEDGETLVLRQGERDSEIPKKDVARVDSVTRNLDALLDNAARAERDDAAALELLASQAQECGLDGEAQVFWWRLLLLDPEHEAAHRALGHRKRDGGWAIPVGGRALDWDRRFQLARDWGSGWELSSLHYRLRSNLALDETLDVVLDLERLYQAVYGLLGAELRLYDVTQPMNVCLHADAASYPETANEFGHYEPATDMVHVDASKGLVWETLAHEATHQLLHDTAFRQASTSGEIPPWVNEGLAEYVAAGVERAPGLEFVPGRLQARHFRAHARAKQPFDIRRVLSLSSGDYQSSSDRELKYAQSYTLVHFLLHGDGGSRRAGFLEYLREVYRGKGSATDLKRCLRADWRKLERDWTAFVRNQPL